MATVTLPAGTVPVRSLTTGQVLTGNRSGSVSVDLLDGDENPLGTLDGVDYAQSTVDYTASASVHGGGALAVVDNGQTVDWLTNRVRPVYKIDGVGSFALGVYIVGAAPEAWSGTGRVWTVELLDKTAILAQDEISEAYAIDAGDTVTDEIVTLIESTGETNHAITPSSKTMPAARVWLPEPGVSKLTIVNDLLDLIGYRSLYCDGNGQFRAEPYTEPTARPRIWEFLDGETSIYSPDFTRDVDLYRIPNKVTLVGQGSGDTAALTAVATNDNADSPYSTTSRGRTIAITEQSDAADQTTLDAQARRRLIELTTPTSSIPIKHAFVVDLVSGRPLSFSDAVQLRRVPAGIDARHVIGKTSIPLDVTALVTSTLVEVVDIG